MPESIAVVYFTKGGAAGRYAEIIARELEAAGHAVDRFDLRATRRFALEPYTTVVFGTGVRIGMVYWRARRFLRRKELHDKLLAVFLASGIAVEDPGKARRKFLEPLVARRGLEPVMLAAFPGMMPGPGGKLTDTTDEAPARAWARDLAVLLQ